MFNIFMGVVLGVFVSGVIIMIVSKKVNENSVKEHNRKIARADKLLTEIMENLAEEGRYNISIYDHKSLFELDKNIKMYYGNKAKLEIMVIDNENKIIHVDDKNKVNMHYPKIVDYTKIENKEF